MSGFKADPYAYPPRGFDRDGAARYVGIGTSLFDEMVHDRRMPKPRVINHRRVWDRHELDAAFADLPHREVNPIDEAKRRGEAARAARGE